LIVFFENRPSDLQLKALRKSTVYAFSKVDLNFLTGDDEFNRFYHQKIITALIEESSLKTKLISLSSESFYKYLLKEHKEIIQNVPSKYIAELMGITPQWLVKIKLKI
jgi:hypothetical protein